MIQIQIIEICIPEYLNHHSAISMYKFIDTDKSVVIWTREEIVNWILQDTFNHKAYVIDRRGDIAYCEVIQNEFGTVFLKTYPDGIFADNLLSLPRF